MTLELGVLNQQVQTMARSLAGQREEYGQRLERLQAVFRSRAADLEGLRDLAISARGAGCQGAIPTEPLDATHPLPPCPEAMVISAADGSQIEVDRHGMAMYYLINLGSIVYHHGSGAAPTVRSEPTLFYREDELYEDGRLVQGNRLDSKRSVMELAKLANLASPDTAEPSLALVDGSLLLWVLEESRPEVREELVGRYLRQLDRLAEARVPVAGYVSRPRHHDVVNLLELAERGPGAATQEQRLLFPPDRALFEHLLPGERTAPFIVGTQTNDMYGRHRLHFFYLNAGAEIARVEVPQWVAQDQGLMDDVHAGIFEQCRAAGYPYVLARAHELAVVAGADRDEFERMVMAALLGQGLGVSPSMKAWLKELTGGRRSRRR
ncbi:MAG: DNA double-strand break repair nuclease NurA [Chloroflexi bacterium]|nr:DNA double-strand break repair nuclease NurA [Chloroflexota bacterium]